MNSNFDASARKRPVNLTLSEDLVAHAKSLRDNLSGVVESLLSGYAAKARDEQLKKAKAVESSMTMWNEFSAKSGSISGEYSTL